MSNSSSERPDRAAPSSSSEREWSTCSGEKNFYNALVRRYGFEDAAQEIQDLYLGGKKEEAAAAIPPELIDQVTICGPRDRVKERLDVYRAAGVGTLIVSPMSFDPEQRKRTIRELAEML